MGKKLGLKGFSNFRMFPVLEDSGTLYKTGESFMLPQVQEMTRENDTSEQKIYADDSLYMNIKGFNGVKAGIKVAELSLKLRALLGDGIYDEETGVFKWIPDGEKPVFGCTYQVLNASGGARLYRLYAFQVEEIKEAGHKTQGENIELQIYEITGTFVKRKLDNSPGAVLDVSNLSDLSFIETLE